jgi:hypothetical protein
MRYRHRRPVALAIAAALAVTTAAAPAAARPHRLLHPPIHVATPTDGSPITPYFFGYGWRYRYNSPGPVYSRLDYAGEAGAYRCRLWRYNYLYWVC